MCSSSYMYYHQCTICKLQIQISKKQNLLKISSPPLSLLDLMNKEINRGGGGKYNIKQRLIAQYYC